MDASPGFTVPASRNVTIYSIILFLKCLVAFYLKFSKLSPFLWLGSYTIAIWINSSDLWLWKLFMYNEYYHDWANSSRVNNCEVWMGWNFVSILFKRWNIVWVSWLDVLDTCAYAQPLRQLVYIIYKPHISKCSCFTAYYAWLNDYTLACSRQLYITNTFYLWFLTILRYNLRKYYEVQYLTHTHIIKIK